MAAALFNGKPHFPAKIDFYQPAIAIVVRRLSCRRLRRRSVFDQ